MPTVPLVAQKALASCVETSVPTVPFVAQKAFTSVRIQYRNLCANCVSCGSEGTYFLIEACVLTLPLVAQKTLLTTVA